MRPLIGCAAVLGVLALIALLFLGSGCSSYQRIVQLDEQAKSQWAQVDTQLQRRYDLIPNLVETVKGYAAHERGVFDDLAEARTSYFSAPKTDDNARAAAATHVESALSRLLALREAYPQLKADEGFLKLQDQLEGTENRISVERQRYNDAVRELNTYLRNPSAIVGNWFAHVQPREYFQTTDAARSAPHVDFGAAAPRPGAPQGPAPAPTPAPAPAPAQ